MIIKLQHLSKEKEIDIANLNMSMDIGLIVVYLSEI